MCPILNSQIFVNDKEKERLVVFRSNCETDLKKIVFIIIIWIYSPPCTFYWYSIDEIVSEYVQ